MSYSASILIGNFDESRPKTFYLVERLLGESMLNQLIGISGTIVAAIIGFIALIVNNAKSNRHTLELEKLRIEAEKAKEKAKKNAAVIEEVYILLTNINSEITQNIEFNNPTLQGKQLQDYIRRVKALIYLYLPSLREKFDIFMKELYRFSTKVEAEQKISKAPNVWKTVSEPYKEYQAKLKDVQSALENLVR